MTPSRVVERWPDGQGRFEATILSASLAEAEAPEAPEAPAGPTASLELPSLETLTLFFDTREQADTNIINETVNNKNMYNSPSSNSFTYRQDPPSVDIENGVQAENPFVEKVLIHDTGISGDQVDTDGIQTMMILVKPEDISPRQSGPQSYIVSYHNDNNILLDQNSNSEFSYFIAGGAGDPNTDTDLPATQSVWQTVCYVFDVDGANKQNGYHNGVLGAGFPLNKSFDLAAANGTMELGFVNNPGVADFTGSFGAYAQWTSSLSATEVAEAHNFFRSISVDYGLPEA